MKRVGIWVIICGCMSMWLGAQPGANTSVAEGNPVGRCWNSAEKKFVPLGTLTAERCQEPGSYCVSVDDCAYIHPKLFRTTISRIKTSNCVDGPSSSDCTACPQGKSDGLCLGPPLPSKKYSVG